jgi:hypothetical protein
MAAASENRKLRRRPIDDLANNAVLSMPLPGHPIRRQRQETAIVLRDPACWPGVIYANDPTKYPIGFSAVLLQVAAASACM